MKQTQISSQELIVNKGAWKNRVIVGTAVTGLVRIEWVQARYNQLIPTNWTMAEAMQFISSTMPLRFQVSDAQNLIVKRAIEMDAEWLFLLEQDNVLPSGGFLMLNDYMRNKKYPIVSGLYFTKSVPPEPLIYRNSGGSYYQDWKMGDKVWCSGTGTGCVLIHMSIIRAVWNESPEYMVGGQISRRVFEEPNKIWFDPERMCYLNESGTSDLAFYKRLKVGKYFEKAGWSKYQKMDYPILVDTNFFVGHIDETGRSFPLQIPKEFLTVKKKIDKKSKKVVK